MKLIYYQKNLIVKPSRIQGAGMGLFARDFIPKGKKLGWYRGELITRQEWIDSEDDSYMWMIKDSNDTEFYIDGSTIKKNNKLRYVNGCMTPSQKFCVNVDAYQSGNKIWYETTRKIHKGEELIVDYGGDYWDPVEV